MELLGVLVALAVLSVPIMLIVTLVKVCGLENQIADLARKVSMPDLTRSRGVAEGNVSRRDAEAQRDLNLGASPLDAMHGSTDFTRSRGVAEYHASRRDAEAQRGPELGAKPPAPQHDLRASAPLREIPHTPSKPTAFDLFWMRVEDWIAVRGDFAPKGMTHEFAFATRWLVRIGVALIVGAIIYFVKLSIDRGWMGPTGRVVATLFWGMVGCVGGSWLVKKGRYALLGHAFAALGVVALYLGFGLGHRFFDPPVITSPTFAFAALAAVTLVAGVMAVCLHSPYIAVMGLVGGYLVPVVAGRDSGFPLWLDAYLLVLSLGAFYVARMRKWSALDFLASMLAFVMCCVWCGRHPDAGGRSAVLVNFAFLSLVHALYMVSVIVDSRSRGKAGNAIAWAGLVVNACSLFGWLATVFRGGFTDRLAGVVLLGLVAAYLSVAALSVRRGWTDRATVNILLVFALTYLAVSPVLLFGNAWWTVSWAAIAVAASEAEARSGQKVLGALSWIILFVASFAGLFHFAPLEYCVRSVGAIRQLSGGEYFSEFALRLVRLWSLPAAAAFIAWRRRVGPLAVAAMSVTFLFFTGEARIFGYVFFPSLKTGMVSIAWLVAAFAGLWAGIARRSRVTRIAALSLLGVSVVKVLLMDTARLATPARVGIFALAGVLLIVGAFLYMKFKERFESADGKAD